MICRAEVVVNWSSVQLWHLHNVVVGLEIDRVVIGDESRERWANTNDETSSQGVKEARW